MTEAVTLSASASTSSHSRLQWQILAGFVLGLAGGLIVYAAAPDAAWVQAFIVYVTTPL